MSNEWLVFSASLSTRQQALRVKVWRRLAALGAVQLKNALWLLPARRHLREALGWLAQEAEAAGGEAVVLACSDLGGVSAGEAQELFRRARDEDYATLDAQAREAAAGLARQPGDEDARREARAFLRRAQRRLDALRDMDFFPSGRGEAVLASLAGLAQALAQTLDGSGGDDAPPPCRSQDYQGRVWVTRERPYIDRLSSFWLITRRIDREASIRFLAEGEGVPAGAAFVSFDMPGAHFSHRGELVTFEVLACDFGLGDVAVRRLAGIVRAIDLADDTGEDGGLPAEARAVKDVLDGLIKISKDDAELLERALLLFDALAASYTPENSNAGACA